jgi:hypothetical protein
VTLKVGTFFANCSNNQACFIIVLTFRTSEPPRVKMGSGIKTRRLLKLYTYYIL